MTPILIDATLLEKLTAITQPVDLCDAEGRVRGRYFPVLDPGEYTVEPQVGDAEIKRRLQDKSKSYSTSEVMAHMANL
jgi:hypothetical protein